jgi:FSR family fosmidomycin resistance protein-like MFS transporter
VASGILTSLAFVVALFVSGPIWVGVMASGTFILMSAIPVNITQAHELARSHMSTVSALLMGLAWGVGSLIIPVVAPLSTMIGLRAVLALVGLLPLTTGFLAMVLPAGKKSEVEHSVSDSTLVPAGGD